MRQPRRLLSVVDAVLSAGSNDGAAAPAASAALLESLVASWDKWVPYSPSCSAERGTLMQQHAAAPIASCWQSPSHAQNQYH